LLAIALVLALLVSIGALFIRLNGLAFGNPIGATTENRMSYLPILAHLTLVLIAGIWLPPAVVVWFQNVAGLLG
jgi:hydrogenase-4 component F